MKCVQCLEKKTRIAIRIDNKCICKDCFDKVLALKEFKPMRKMSDKFFKGITPQVKNAYWMYIAKQEKVEEDK